MWLLVHPQFPAKNVSELIALAKAKPGQMTFGSASGETPHLGMELVKMMAKEIPRWAQVVKEAKIKAE